MFRFILIFSILFINFAQADILQGQIKYNEETARIEAFKDLARKVPKEMFKDYKKDKYSKENIAYLKNKIYIVEKEPKRNINPFYILNNIALYSVQYENDMNTIYYYDIFGNLKKFEINDFSGIYPYRAVAYDKNGNLMSLTFVTSKEESFVFNKNEKLLGHWIDSYFYGKKGKKNYTRILE